MKRLAAVILVVGMLVGLFACGGGGGSGGGGPYSHVGVWQVVSTDTTSTNIIGATFTFKSNGKGSATWGSIKGPITWIQNGNAFVVYLVANDPLVVSLSWSGPDRVRWTNQVGGSFDLVKIGVAGVVMTPVEQTPSGASLEAVIKAMRTGK